MADISTPGKKWDEDEKAASVGRHIGQQPWWARRIIKKGIQLSVQHCDKTHHFHLEMRVQYFVLVHVYCKQCGWKSKKEFW